MPFIKGQSGNPSGRRKGSKNKKTLVLQELEEGGTALAASIKASALNGDSSAMSLWLSRLEPPARSRGEHVEFEFDPSATPAKNIESVLVAVSGGELTLEAGSMIINAIEKLAGVRVATEATEGAAALIEAFKSVAGKLPV
jgi:hypothetical protein